MQIETLEEKLELLRAEYDHANDSNDVNAQVRIAQEITETGINLNYAKMFFNFLWDGR
jgi:hypothetical protein